jgi:hypothetical protein
MEKAVMIFSFYFYDSESLGEKGNGMESNDQRRHFLSVLHVIYFRRMGIKSLHILTFAR